MDEDTHLDYFDETEPLGMNDSIHWSPREFGVFLQDHKEINTAIVINETMAPIDYKKIYYDDNIYMYDIIFTANIITEFISNNSHLLYVKGTIGYSADTQDANFIYDKKTNIIYVESYYRLMTGEIENEIYTEGFEVSYDKYWKFENNNLNEYKMNVNYESIENSMPYYRFPRTKDGISVLRVIYNVFKIFSYEKVFKPKIVIPNCFNLYNRIKKE
jgi:hypothetical protein